MRRGKLRMTRREAMATGLAGAATVCAAAGADPQRESEGKMDRPPNLLFIITDQQRFDALSCAGSDRVSTPNLDRLAAEGVRFANAYTPSPMCVPARTAFMTGLSIHTTHCISLPNDPWMDFRDGTFDQNLVKHGYHAEYHGRWHAPLAPTDCYANEVTLRFVDPYKRYLAETVGTLPEPGPGQIVDDLYGWPYTPDAPDYDLRAAQGNPPPHGVQGVRYGVSACPAEHGYTAFVADETIRALERNRDRAFSITAAALVPHHPMLVPRRFAESVDPAVMTPPETLHDRRLNTPYEEWPWQMDQTDMDAIGVMQARYYALVQEADYHVGRILDALDRLGLAERTLVVFASDHGEFMGDHGLAQKFLPYRESVRVPLIMRFPGKIAPGTTVDHVANTKDLFATIFDYFGLPCPEQEGRSLRPLADGGSDGGRDFTICEHGWEDGYVLIATEDWKYVWTGPRDAPDLLFDLRADPRELTNLLGSNPARGRHLAQARALREKMLAWMAEIRHPYLERLARSEIG